ncbi:MAG: hypothetical protein LBE24_07795 [Methylobacillus sp.]|jgi:hypothetical protein|nr:hypothetical protein [Methylobacillus sp.]
MDNLSELIYLLSNRDLDKNEAISIADAARATVDSGEFDWIDDDERQLMFSVEDQLSDWFAVSDKIDELHEQLYDWFSDPPLLPFPHDLDPLAYFDWLDNLLAKRPKGNYELLRLDNGVDDNIHAVLVRRADTPRILELCKTLGFRVYPANSAT